MAKKTKNGKNSRAKNVKMHIRNANLPIEEVAFPPLNKATCLEEDCCGENTPSFPIENTSETLL